MRERALGVQAGLTSFANEVVVLMMVGGARAYKDPSVKVAEKLENLPVVKRAARRHFLFNDGGSDSDDGSHGGESSHGGDDGDDCSHGVDDGGTPTN
jgi:hypothetical protein